MTPQRTLTDQLATGLVAALFGALLAGLAEGLWILGDGGRPVGPVLLVTLGFWVPISVGLMATWIGGLVLSRTTPIQHLLAEWRTDRAATWGTLLLVIAAGLGLTFTLGRTAKILQHLLKNRTLIEPTMLVASLFWLTLFLMGLAIFWEPTRQITRRLGSKVAAVIVLLLIVGLLFWVGQPVLHRLAKDLSPRPFFLVLIALTSTAVFGRWTYPRWVLPALAGLAGLVVGIAPGIYTQNNAVRLAIGDGRGLTPQVIQVVQRLGDKDRDGASRWLAGGDCDDNNPKVYPLALDVPENGLDEDCDGHDAKLIKKVRHRVKQANIGKLKRHWNLLFVTIDALRPDRLPMFGHSRNTAPTMGKLARNGLVFERAYAPATATRHSVPSIFSGRALGDMGIDRRSTTLTFVKGNEFLFERLTALGYHTEVHVGEYLKSHIWRGLDQGVARFVGHADVGIRDPWTAPKLTNAALAMFEAMETSLDTRPWALWLHYQEPHEPYARHEGIDFGDRPIDLYDGEIKAVDNELARLLKALEDRDLRKNTIVVVTSDHGEEFGEHGRRYHGRQLYEETIRVPLLISVPGVKGVRISEPMSLIDLPETLANLMGAKPGLDYGARSFAGYLVGKAPRSRGSVFVDCIHHDDRPNQRQHAVIDWPYKAILDLRGGTVRLFNLQTDPKELKNLVSTEAKQAERLTAILRARVKQQHTDEVQRMRANRIEEAAPENSDAKPRLLASGLLLLKAEAKWVEEGTYELHLWLKAVGSRRPDVQLHVEWFDANGRRRYKRTSRPLAGRYPTHRWKSGEVVHEILRVRIDKGKPPFEIQLSSKVGRKKVLFGPAVVAHVKPGQKEVVKDEELAPLK